MLATLPTIRPPTQKSVATPLGEGVRHPTLGNNTMAGRIAFKFCVWLETH